MARQRLQASRAASARAVDDFKRIRGIGPALEKHLHGAGIHTFSQFAALPPETIASLIPNRSANQVIKQGWLSQARKLAPAKAKSPHKKATLVTTGRQHYENFTFEFLLDEKNMIHRMRMVHVQSGDVDTWAEWNTERLIAFLAWHTGACLPYAKPVTPTILKIENSPASATLPGHPPGVVEEITSLPQIPVPVGEAPPEAAHPHAPPHPIPTTTPDKIRIVEWKTMLAGTRRPVHGLSHDQAFDVRLMLDLSNTSLSGESQIDFTTKLYAKKMGGGGRQLVSETQNTVPYSTIVDATIRNVYLSQGLYRLEAFLTLMPTATSRIAERGIEVVFQGGLLQVY